MTCDSRRLHRPRGCRTLLVLPFLGLAACDREAPTAPETTGGTPAVTGTSLRVVNSRVDPGDGTCDAAECTLREALRAPAGSEIRFARGFTGPIVLAAPGAGGGPLRIERSATITGPSGRVVIRRRSTDPPFRIMGVAPGATVALRNLTLTGGKTDRGGGGIINQGTLALTNCRVVENASARSGGGIDNYGPLTIAGSVIARNTSPRGAGVTNHDDQTITITGSTVSRNQGDGIYDGSGTLVIRQSDITYNAGDGIFKSRETMTLDRVRIVGNTGRGLWLTAADTRMDRGTIARNALGGIRVVRSLLTITGSTISGNSGAYGGGIEALAVPRVGVEVRLTNSTVSGNSADVGGGIYSEDHFAAAARVYLDNATVAYNTATRAGGGIFQEGDPEEEGAWLYLTNSIVARNAAPTAPEIEPGRGYVNASHTLISDGTGLGIQNEGGNLVGNVPPYPAPIDPRLGLLSRNGGPTATHALLAGSPAIDAGTSEGCPATDQRGVRRPQGEACDMGSFESEAGAPGLR